MLPSRILSRPLNNVVLNVNSTSPASWSIRADVVIRPSSSRGADWRGEPPSLTMTDVGVRSTTSNWSMNSVPTSNVLSRISCWLNFKCLF